MKTVRSKHGPFAQRPYYSPGELERICSDALKSCGLLPESPEAVRIDRFVEKFFKVTPRYEPLPDGVLGYTEFGQDGVSGIVVTALLDAEGSAVAERRIRTTLAHEGGHGLLHTYLFALGDKPRSLFDDESERPEILCRDVQGETKSGRGYDGRWWEFQANQAIGCLLMPRSLVHQAIEPFCEVQGGLGLKVLKEEERGQAARMLADLFDVNPVVARIRLDALFPANKSGQLTL